MAITIICVGKIKESYIKEGIQDYEKRIRKFTKLNIIEVKEEDCNKDSKNAVLTEGRYILEKLPKNSYIITMDIQGKQLSSTELADKIENIYTNNSSEITFIIGGSIGLSDEIKEKSNFKLSFSKCTFPHQLFRMILLEQIYRAYKINNNETYHK